MTQHASRTKPGQQGTPAETKRTAVLGSAPVAPSVHEPSLELDTAGVSRAASTAAFANYGTGGFDASHFEQAAHLTTLRDEPSSRDELAESELEAEAAAGPVLEVEARAVKPSSPKAEEQRPKAPRQKFASIQILPPKPEPKRDGVLALADYGPAPERWFETPLYALRVRQRRAALMARLRELVPALAQAEEEYERALEGVAIALRPTAENDERYADLFDNVKVYDEQIAERDQVVSSLNTRYGQQIVALGGEEREADARVTERRALEQAARAELDEVERSHGRADARVKRLHIEMRGIKEQAERLLGSAGGPMPPELAQKLAALAEQAQTLEPALAEQTALLQARTTEHTSLVNQVAHLEHAARAVRDKRAALEGRQRKETEQAGKGLDEIGRERRRELAFAGSLMLPQARTLGSYASEVHRVERAEQRLLAVGLEHETHLRALDAHDTGALKRGTLLIAAAVLVVLLLLAGGVIRAQL
jgi:hypothetical protein